MLKLTGSGCLPPDGSSRAELVVDEALTNAIVHGNQSDPAKTVRLRLFADEERWGAIVEDQGEGFERETPDADGSLKESGRGIMLMDEYLEELIYAAPGNAVMLVAKREAGSGEPSAAASFEGSIFSALAEEDVVQGDGPVAVMDRGDVAVARVQADSVFGDNAEEVRAAFTQATEGRRVLVIDMRRVHYVSSVGLAVLVATYKLMDAKGGTVVLVAVGPEIKDLLAKSDLTALFRFAANLDEAFTLIGGDAD
jgi:anti-anti-sigma factor